MKVFSDPTRVSPLETWLRDGDLEDASATQPSGQPESAITALVEPPTPIADNAEKLLGLDVWSGTTSAGRLLVAAAGPPPTTAPTATTTAQQWADHIFEPLR